MSSTTPPVHSANVDAIFAQLGQQVIEEFYVGYQYWHLHQQLRILQDRLEQTRRLMIENAELLQQVQPTAIELATLARLEANGVSDVNLLERLLERGESWMDRTMQRLDYLEQLDDFIRDDYTQWCKHALEGAYDWIDSVLDGGPPSSVSNGAAPVTIQEATEDVKQAELIEATEALFLQKISADDELSINEITLKRASITGADLETGDVPPEAMDVDADEAPSSENAFQSREAGHTTPTSDERSDTGGEVEAPASTSLQPEVQETAEKVATAKTPSSPSTRVTQVTAPTKRPGLLKRFLSKIWGS